VYYNREVKKTIMAIISLLIIASSVAVPRALAAPDDATIAANCQQAQSTLRQIQKTDAVARINRGRAYSDILNDLLFTMNARLANNRLPTPHLSEITSEFQARLTNFRGNYDHYDDSLNAASGHNCVDNPAEFYEKLEKARTDRATVASDIERLDQLTRDYQTELANVTAGVQ
jgi:hypothetical protein